jgi:hypothetical protein
MKMPEELDIQIPDLLFPEFMKVLNSRNGFLQYEDYCLHKWPKDEDWWVVVEKDKPINAAVYIGPVLGNALWYLQHPNRLPPFRYDLLEKE